MPARPPDLRRDDLRRDDLVGPVTRTGVRVVLAVYVTVAFLFVAFAGWRTISVHDGDWVGSQAQWLGVIACLACPIAPLAPLIGVLWLIDEIFARFTGDR
ncbi:MAG: hypothetical protein GY929_18280 [Actinomycetia bacterium]|nr:hypothetical protein [Actinomycetes bacterium]